MFENVVLMRLFGPKMEEVTGDWRKFNNEELHDLYLSPDIIQLIKLTVLCGACHMYGVGEK